MAWRIQKLFHTIRCSSTCCVKTQKNRSKSLIDDSTMDETTSSFYITLPSNACKDIYPENTASEFKVRLVKELRLDYAYEVALVEIQFPHTWNTLNGAYFKYKRDGTLFTIHIPTGFYESPRKLITELNDAFEQNERDIERAKETNNADKDKPLPPLNNIKFQYDPFSRHSEIYIRNGYELELGDGLAQVLGFTQPSFVHTRARTTSDQAVDTDRGFYSLYVYCDLCKPQFVGDAYVPLLRVIDTKGKDRQMITKTYSQPHYVPINSNRFDTIEINIKTDTGENVSFALGKVICKLHFRSRR